MKMPLSQSSPTHRAPRLIQKTVSFVSGIESATAGRLETCAFCPTFLQAPAREWLEEGASVAAQGKSVTDAAVVNSRFVSVSN